MCIWMPQSETNLVFGSEPARKLRNFNISLHTCLVFWALALIKHFQKICLTKCRLTYSTQAERDSFKCQNHRFVCFFSIKGGQT